MLRLGDLKSPPTDSQCTALRSSFHFLFSSILFDCIQKQPSGTYTYSQKVRDSGMYGFVLFSISAQCIMGYYLLFLWPLMLTTFQGNILCTHYTFGQHCGASKNPASKATQTYHRRSENLCVDIYDLKGNDYCNVNVNFCVSIKQIFQMKL